MLVIVIFLFMFVLPTGGRIEVFAASIEFGEDFPSFKVGDTVRIPVYVNSENDNVFIARANIYFPQKLLWAKSFAFSPGWVPVQGEDYDFTDNSHGIIIKTAGLEKGLSVAASGTVYDTAALVLLGTIEFVAIGEGIAGIQAGDGSYVYDSNNQNILNKSGSAKVAITGLSNSKLPPQLFDIRLELESATVYSASDLAAYATFENFGQAQTPVDMVFTITDGKGKIFANFKESVIVETKEIFTKKFDKIVLPVGDYALHMNTRYNADIEDDFHAPFRIAPRRQAWRDPGAGILFALCGVIYAFLIWRRKKSAKNALPLKGNINQ